MKTYPILFSFLFLSVLQACTPAKQLVPAGVQYKDYQVRNDIEVDTAVLKMLKPYSDSVRKTMDKVIGFATAALYKKQPEGPVGNFMVDAMKSMAEQKFGRPIDAAIVNSGGIRSFIPKGDITIGHIYEIMPFDNLVVLQQLKGSVLKKFLDHIAYAGGWPVAGIQMKIKDRKAEDILIAGKPLDENATYWVANSDYIANGGDNSEMLKGIPQLNIGYLFRDALIEYVQQYTRQGKPVTAQIENRVTSDAKD